MSPLDPRALLRGVARSALRRLGMARPAGAEVPVLRRHEGPRTTPPTVYFLTPDYDEPSGGIRTLYRHVDLLEQAGISAAVLHSRPGFACTWFEHHTRIRHVPSTPVGAQDILVVPEVYGASIRRLPRGVRQVLFNQGAYLTFARAGLTDTAPSPYQDNPDLSAVLVVSEDSAAYLRYAFPSVRVERVHPAVDPTLFHARGRESRRRIALMSRRNREDAVQVLQMLRARGSLRDWAVDILQGLTPARVAEALRGSALFLTFSHQEGFGLPPVEAMACGCLVVGFHGQGGREFLRPEWSLPVEQGNIVAFSQRVEEAIRLHREDPARFEAMSRSASEFVHREYAPAREREDVVGFYRALLRDAERGS
ncbi:glycosyltransferase family 4 protein [Myxococcaceae bacterium JPH2]|nr:glycosyltransferase family 4 protein [Myxococcaceae bacterium JPH2]